MIRKLESLEIKDGKIILKVRAKPAPSTDSPQRKKEAPGRGCGSPDERRAQERTGEKGRADPKPTEPAAPRSRSERADIAGN